MHQYEKLLNFLSKEEENTLNNDLVIKELKIMRARVYLKQGRFDESIDLLKNLLKDSRFSITARYYSGICYYQSGNYNMALDYFRQVVQGSDEFFNAWSFYYLGEIQMIKEEYVKAARDYTKIVYLYSGNKEIFEKALYKSSLAFFLSAKNKEYQIYLEKLKENFPESAYILELENISH
jgi:tetratricopeptide (TPR) repeat protein